MATVISNNKLQEHNVDKYNFKVIALSASSDVKETEENSTLYTESENPRARITDVDSSALSTSSKESLIESLMQKTDEMSSNFIKLQMKLESKEEEYLSAIEKAKEEAFSEGLAAGSAKAHEEVASSNSESMTQFSSSVKTLEESAETFNKALEGIKKELITAALDIASEVVKVELSENSNEIAKVLSTELLKDLQSAAKVTLKVNPINHGTISEFTGAMSHVNVISDSAVSPGGVIVISDAGNVDSQINKRFERVKRAALSE